MTRPSLIVFQDAASMVDGPKVWLRTLLYSTAKRGNVIEGMFVRLRRDNVRQTFSFWGCGERNELVRGSGLYVDQSGVALNHHFSLSGDSYRFEFAPGDYVVEIFALLVGRRGPLPLTQIALHLTEEHAKALKNVEDMIHFDLTPESGGYAAYVRRRPERLASG